MIEVNWCSLCNKRPADGIATVEDDGNIIDLPLCLSCKDAIAGNN